MTERQKIAICCKIAAVAAALYFAGIERFDAAACFFSIAVLCHLEAKLS